MEGVPGKFLKLPYDWRRPTKERLKKNAWDADGKVFTPKTVGWGYGVNFRAAWKRLTGR
jgi:hypothetical protein